MKKFIAIILALLLGHSALQAGNSTTDAIQTTDNHAQAMAEEDAQTIEPCGICLESNWLFQLSCQCNMQYHAKCILQWDVINNSAGTCPLCRSTISAEDKKRAQQYTPIKRAITTRSFAALNQPDRYGNTLLHKVVMLGFIDLVKLLTSIPGINVNAKNLKHQTPLHLAALQAKKKFSPTIILVLIAAQADLAAKDLVGDTPLHYIASTQQKDSIEAIAGAQFLTEENPAIVNNQNNYGDTPLLCATATNNVDIAEILLKAGASMMIKGRGNKTAWRIASEKNCKKMISLFRDHNAALDAFLQQKATIALQHAVTKPVKTKKDLSALIEKLVDLTMSENASTTLPNKHGMNSLHLAAAAGQVDALNLLINEEVSVDIQDSNGNTSLHHATINNHGNTVLYLIESGANLEIPNINGDTPLLLAVQERRYKVVQLLLNHNANKEVRNRYGKTSLHLAVNLNDLEMVKLLLAAGADCMSEDESGRNPFSLATTLGYHDIRAELHSAISIIQAEQRAAARTSPALQSMKKSASKKAVQQKQ